MKKISILISLVLLFTTANYSYALGLNVSAADNPTSRSAEKTALKTTAQTNLVDNLKKRADLEIQRRIDALNRLTTKIGVFKKLSSLQKSDLTTQIQTQIDGLNALKLKIDADTDLTTLRADVKSIITDYRIFAFFIVDINLLSSSERIETVLDNLTVVQGKLQTRISEAQTNGADVTSLNALLSDMQTQISSGKTLISTVNSQLTGLTASGYPANKTTLADGRTKLKSAFQAAKTASKDAKEIIGALRAINKTNNSSSSAVNKP